MFTFERDGNDATFKVDLDVPKYEVRCFPFTFHCIDKVCAGFLTGLLQKTIENKIKEARSAEYSEGYKDGRNHAFKKDWFSTQLD